MVLNKTLSFVFLCLYTYIHDSIWGIWCKASLKSSLLHTCSIIFNFNLLTHEHHSQDYYLLPRWQEENQERIPVRGLRHPNKSKEAWGAIRRPAFCPLPCLHHQQWFLEMPRKRGVTHTLSQAHPHQHQNRRRRRDLPKRVSLKVETQQRMTQAMMVWLYISGTFFTFSFLNLPSIVQEPENQRQMRTSAWGNVCILNSYLSAHHLDPCVERFGQ